MAGDNLTFGAGALGLYWVAGPAIKAVGASFGEWTKSRMDNVLSIGEKVARRVGADAPDDGQSVPPRVFYEVLNEGSWISDDVQQEYLAGLLIASRTPLGKNDDGAYYARLVTGMTSNQIRFHHAIYDAILRQAQPFMIGVAVEAQQNCVWAPIDASVGVVAPEDADSLEAVVTATVVGLERLQLADSPGVGSPSILRHLSDRPVNQDAMVLAARPAGASLFMWAHGMRSSDQDRLFELRGRPPLGPTFSEFYISSASITPDGLAAVI